MSTKDDGGSAFPLTGTQWNPDREMHDVSPIDTGMTLRDYFAAKAMAAFIANNEKGLIDMPWVAEGAYRIADHMLRARGE